MSDVITEHTTEPTEASPAHVPAGASYVGAERESNEDRYVFVTCPSGFACAVCDGMGGAPGGEFAAQLAVDAIKRCLCNETEPDLDALVRAVHEANQDIVEHREQGAASSMGTTLVAVLFNDTGGTIVHVGDSRAYVVHRREGRLVTSDHTYVQEWVAQGNLSEAAAVDHPQAHVLSKCLGVSPEVEPTVLRFTVTAPNEGERCDSIVLVTDGLHRMVSTEEIAELVGRMPSGLSASRILELAKDRGGPDDMTIAVIPVRGIIQLEMLQPLVVATITDQSTEPTVLPLDNHDPALEYDNKPDSLLSGTELLSTPSDTPDIIKPVPELQRTIVAPEPIHQKRNERPKSANKKFHPRALALGSIAIACLGGLLLLVMRLTVKAPLEEQAMNSTAAEESAVNKDGGLAQAPLASAKDATGTEPSVETPPADVATSQLPSDSAQPSTEATTEAPVQPSNNTSETPTEVIAQNTAQDTASLPQTATPSETASSLATDESAVPKPQPSATTPSPTSETPVVTPVPSESASRPQDTSPVATTPVQPTPASSSPAAEQLFTQGLASVGTGNTDWAITYFEQAVAIRPDFPEAYYNLGTLYAQKQRYDDSVHAFQQVLQFNPKFIEAVYNLGYVYAQKGNKDDARKTFQQFIDLASQNEKFKSKIPTIQQFIEKLK